MLFVKIYLTPAQQYSTVSRTKIQLKLSEIALLNVWDEQMESTCKVGQLSSSIIM